MNKLLVTAALVLSTVSANAYDENNLAIGLGAVGAFDENDIVSANLEWRGKRFDQNMIGVANISPIIGGMVDFEGDVYAYGGLLYDWNVSGGWHVVPSLAIGLYEEARGGIDLGGTFEFRSQLEVNYALTPQSRIGMSIAHLSNLGFYDYNPGTENVSVNYSFAY